MNRYRCPLRPSYLRVWNARSAAAEKPSVDTVEPAIDRQVHTGHFQPATKDGLHATRSGRRRYSVSSVGKQPPAAILEPLGRDSLARATAELKAGTMNAPPSQRIVVPTPNGPTYS